MAWVDMQHSQIGRFAGHWPPGEWRDMAQVKLGTGKLAPIGKGRAKGVHLDQRAFRTAIIG